MSKRKLESKTENKRGLLLVSSEEDKNYVPFPKHGEDKVFLDLFSYEEIVPGNKQSGKDCCFEKCTILKDFGIYKSGDKVDWISFGLNLYISKEGDLDEQLIYFE